MANAAPSPLTKATPIAPRPIRATALGADTLSIQIPTGSAGSALLPYRTHVQDVPFFHRTAPFSSLPQHMPVCRRQAAAIAGVPLYPEIIDAMHSVSGNGIAPGAGNAPGTSALDASVLHATPTTTVGCPPPPLTPAPQNGTNTSLYFDIQDLRRSHALLYERVEQLMQEIRMNNAAVEIERQNLLRDDHIFEAYIWRPIRLFAGQCAIKTLRGPTKELSKNVYQLCSGTSIRRTVLKSKATGCSLFEFRIFARACMRDPDIQCDLSPSQYCFLNLHASNTSQLQITFPTYFTFCAALDIDIATRAAGIYKIKKKNRHAVPAVQILGIEQVRTSQSNCERNQRHLFPGISQPRTPEQVPRLCMWQRNATWCDTSSTWEDGFVRSIERPERDANKIDVDDPLFSLIWKKTGQFEVRESATADQYMLGDLRSTIPSIVLRGRLLTTSVHSFFTSRLDGDLVAQLLVTPRVSQLSTDST